MRRYIVSHNELPIVILPHTNSSTTKGSIRATPQTEQVFRHASQLNAACCIHCTIAYVQLHVRDDAIARSPSCNQLNYIYRVKHLAESDIFTTFVE